MYCILPVLASLAAACAAPAQDFREMACDPSLAALFAPARPQLGRYEVCASTEPLSALADPRWRVEMAQPLDALGTAGRYNRGRVARLYGGLRVQVARGSIQHAAELESVTLISPHPDPSLTQLLPGTLVIRHFVRYAPGSGHFPTGAGAHPLGPLIIAKSWQMNRFACAGSQCSPWRWR